MERTTPVLLVEPVCKEFGLDKNIHKLATLNMWQATLPHTTHVLLSWRLLRLCLYQAKMFKKKYLQQQLLSVQVGASCSQLDQNLP